MTLEDFPIYQRSYLTRAAPIVGFQVRDNGIVTVVVPGDEEGKGAMIDIGIKAFPDAEAISEGDYITRDVETDRWKHVPKAEFEAAFTEAS